MTKRTAFIILLARGLWVSACSGGRSESGGPTAPTPTPAPIPPTSAGTTVTTNGCAATYSCPNVDANGNANPTTPTFERLTLNNGTSSSCRADIGPNVPEPGCALNSRSGIQKAATRGAVMSPLAHACSLPVRAEARRPRALSGPRRVDWSARFCVRADDYRDSDAADPSGRVRTRSATGGSMCGNDVGVHET